MPRHSLGQDKSTGTSRSFPVRMSERDRRDIVDALQEGETFAQFVRDAISSKVKSRKKELKC